MDVLGLLARVACVFALLGLTLWVVRRSGAGRGPRRAAALQVVGSTRLTKSAALTVVRVGEQEYVLGVTDSSVTLLTGHAVPTAEVAEVAAGGTATAAVRTLASGADAVRPELPAARAARPAATAGPAGRAARPDFRTALRQQVMARAGRTEADAATPPTTAAFVRGAWRAARGRAVETTEVSPAAVATALEGLRAAGGPAPAAESRTTASTATARPAATASTAAARTAATASTATARPAATTTRTAAAPAAPARPSSRSRSAARTADGPAALSARRAAVRAVARTDAQRDEEHPWTRACRPTFRTATERGGVL